MTDIKLRRTEKTNNYYQKIRDNHYVENHGCMGRQIHYLIWIENELIGIISGASAVYCCEGRDEFFGINKENRDGRIQEIICNTVFKMEKSKPNLGTQILAQWRRKITKDWFERYGIIPIGFETFIYGEGRFGSLYKADNWHYCGMTKGMAKYTPHGMHEGFLKIKTEPKMIFCKYNQIKTKMLYRPYLFAGVT